MLFDAHILSFSLQDLLMPYHVSWNYNDAIVFKLSEKMCQHNFTSLIMIILDNFPISFMPTPFHILKCKQNLCERSIEEKNEIRLRKSGETEQNFYFSLNSLCFNDQDSNIFRTKQKKSSPRRKFIDFSC